MPPLRRGLLRSWPQFAEITRLLEWSHSIGTCTLPDMQLSFEESWRQEVTRSLEDKLGDLGPRAIELIELTMILTLAGQRDGLVELMS